MQPFKIEKAPYITSGLLGKGSSRRPLAPIIILIDSAQKKEKKNVVKDYTVGNRDFATLPGLALEVMSMRVREHPP